MIDNVIFDMDGTVLNTEKGIFSCLQYSLEKMNYKPLSYDDMCKFIGPSLFVTYQKVCHMTPDEATQAIIFFREKYMSESIFECEFYPGMEQLIRDLKDLGYKLSIASSKPQVAVDKLAQHFPTLKLFDSLVGADFQIEKSDKQHLIKRAIIGKFPIMVGDTMFDIEGANINNIPSIAVRYGFGDDESLKKFNPTFFANTTQDILKIIKEV